MAGIDGITGGRGGVEMDVPSGPSVATDGAEDGKILPPIPGIDPDKPTFVVFGTETCPWCRRTEEFLQTLHEARGDFQVAKVDANAQPAVFQAVAARTGHRTVPQVFLDGRFVGGWRELALAARRGQVDAYLDGDDWKSLKPEEPKKKGWFGRKR